MESQKSIFDLTLVITHRCNLNCVYCYEVNKDAHEMSLDMAKSILMQYLNKTDFDEVAINLFGGEPFLRFPFIKDLCEWAWHKTWPVSYMFYADTNGCDLSDEIKIWTSRNKDRFKMLLSLDGGKETHNSNRSNSFDRIDLDFFMKYWSEQGVKMTIYDKNINSLAEDIIFIHSNGLKIKGCNLAEGIAISDFEATYEKLSEQFSLLVDWYIEHPEIPLAQIFDFNLAICETHRGQKIKHCGCGSNRLKVVDVDGREFPCTYFFPLAMPQYELKKIRQIDLSNEELFFDNDCIKNCYVSPICSGCYGDNYSSTGCLHKKSKHKCAIMKLRIMASTKIQAYRIANNYKENSIDENTRNTIIAINNIYNQLNGDADSRKVEA